MTSIRQPACSSGKKRFDTRRRAKAWLKKNRGSWGGSGARRVYRCPECDLYHATTYTAAETEAIRRRRHEEQP